MIKWSDEQLALREAVYKLSPKLNEDVIRHDAAGVFAHDKWQLLCDIGLPGLVTDEAYGGIAQDLLTTMFVLEGLGYACEDAGLNFAVSTHIVSAEIPILRYGSDLIKERYLSGLAGGALIGAHAMTEPDAGSDVFAMNMKARQHNSHYLLGGSKTFITNGPIADVFVVYAMTDKSRGTLGGVSAFVVEKETPGLACGKPIEKMGLRTAPLCEIYLDDCQIPVSNRLGKEGDGFAIFNTVMNWEILCTAAIHLGEMRRLVEKCIRYGKTRKQFGQAIAKHQAISHKIANMQIGLKAAESVVYSAGQRLSGNMRSSIDIAAAKVLTSEHYVQTTLDAIQIFGAYGYMKEYEIERAMRNAVASKIYSGSSEIQRNKIASLLGL
jgi:alkylation response protein AidB-like acyl-CoA dehydrogenase